MIKQYLFIAMTININPHMSVVRDWTIKQLGWLNYQQEEYLIANSNSLHRLIDVSDLQLAHHHPLTACIFSGAPSSSLFDSPSLQTPLRIMFIVMSIALNEMTDIFRGDGTFIFSKPWGMPLCTFGSKSSLFEHKPHHPLYSHVVSCYIIREALNCPSPPAPIICMLVITEQVCFRSDWLRDN